MVGAVASLVPHGRCCREARAATKLMTRPYGLVLVTNGCGLSGGWHYGRFKVGGMLFKDYRETSRYHGKAALKRRWFILSLFCIFILS